jgi:hypothetical protein
MAGLLDLSGSARNRFFGEKRRSMGPAEAHQFMDARAMHRIVVDAYIA